MPSNTTSNMSPAQRPGVLQRFLLLWFLLAVLWLIVGKSVFGVVGWITIIMFFTVAPFLLVYGTVLWLIVRARNKRSGYLMSPVLQTLVIVFLANLFFYGLVMVDGGDTAESGKSVLTAAFGVNLENGPESPVMRLTESLSGFSIFLSTVLLPTIPLVALLENRKPKMINGKVKGTR